MLDLKNCPFCGGKASIRNGGPGCCFVQCDTCNATSDDHLEETAIAAWNRRALQAVGPEPAVAELYALCYLHDWDPPKESQVHRWEPGKNVFPEVHAFYHSWSEAEAIRRDMVNPERYWVVRARPEDEARIRSALVATPPAEPVAEALTEMPDYVQSAIRVIQEHFDLRLSDLLAALATKPAVKDDETVVEALERARDEIGEARGYTGDPDCHHHLNLALEAIAALAAKDGRS